jgi:hypothetical protein
MHKGFKCLDIPTGYVYISRDVIFDENVFPFAHLHSNVGAHLQTEINLLPPTLLNPDFTTRGSEITDCHVFNAANPANSNFCEDLIQNPAEIQHEIQAAKEVGTGTEAKNDSGVVGADSMVLGATNVAISASGSALHVASSARPDASSSGSGARSCASESPFNNQPQATTTIAFGPVTGAVRGGGGDNHQSFATRRPDGCWRGFSSKHKFGW